MEERSLVRLYTNSGYGDDREARRTLEIAEIPFRGFGPTSEEKTPFIKWGYWRYDGLEEIKKFAERWKVNNLPDPWCGLK